MATVTKEKPAHKEVKKEMIHYHYIPRRIPGVVDKNHILYDGKLDISVDTFFVLQDLNGRFSINLTQEELTWVEQELGLDSGTLNVNDRKNEYLSEISVEVPKFGLSFDLSDPYHVLQDGILSAYSNVFAKGLKDKSTKRSYRYVRVSDDEETDIILEVSDFRKKAYKLLGALEESREKMIMVLLYDNQRIHPQIPTKELRRKVNELVELGYSRFISTMEDPMFAEKGLINMAILTGVIEVKRGLHFFGTEPLAAEKEVPTLTNACLFLADKTNANVRLAISKDTVNDFKRA